MERTYSPIALQNARLSDKFWSNRQRLIRETVIPYQWEALNDRIPDAEPSYAIRNFRIAAGREEGEFGGLLFQDSDVAKWLEAVAYSLAVHPDPELEATADEAIDLIADAQHEDGYLNTYFTIKAPELRWTNLEECHELYCAGHMMEAAVAYYRATGKRKLLEVMCRFADYIDTVFGPEPGKLKGYPGHQEIELALVKLYQVTGERKYLDLSLHFINQRGQEPYYFLEEWQKRGEESHWARRKVTPPNLMYNQSHLPVRQQSVAVGHAVRAVYMYTAMADLAAHTGDAELKAACERLWRNIVGKQLYITGGIGSTAHGEAFTFDYDLPNDTVYAETCASIGLVFFAHRMTLLEPKGEYADVMERALYNTVIAGMAGDGKHYFYVNPLEVWPEASEKNPTRKHVKAQRQPWFGCACCPPNVARLLASLGQYVYTKSADTIFAHLYIEGQSQAQFGDQTVILDQQTDYPWDGRIKLTVRPQSAAGFALALRIPGWCREAQLTVNGERVELAPIIKDGYAYIRRAWSKGDEVELFLPMPVEVVRAHPAVKANAHKAALQRGPLVYCFEQADNQANLQSLALLTDREFQVKADPGLLGGLTVINGKALRTEWDCDQLYTTEAFAESETDVKAIPYFAWNNRGLGEMTVWIQEARR